MIGQRPAERITVHKALPVSDSRVKPDHRTNPVSWDGSHCREAAGGGIGTADFGIEVVKTRLAAAGITNALILDAVQGVIKADSGVMHGRIVGIGHAGNPGIQRGDRGHRGRGCIVTAGGMDTHTEPPIG